MKKNYSVLLFFLACTIALMNSFRANAQTATLLWAKSMGGTGNDAGWSIAADASGNVYTTGNFQGTADFDPGSGVFNLTSAGSDDMFISKTDASGNLLWAKSMGGTGADNGNSIALDASGNVYTTGRFYGTVDFDPGAGTVNLTSAGNYALFISKLDASGNFVWAKQIGGTSSGAFGQFISLDASGNIYTTGCFFGTVDFDPGAGTSNLTSSSTNDIFVSKLDAFGNFVWAKRMGGGNIDDGISLAIDASGNVYTTGYFFGSTDFDPSATTYNLNSAGGTDGFISKLDASGNFVWAKRMGGSGGDYGNSIALDASGNVYLTGSFNGTADFGTFNLTTAGGTDIFISKIDASGNFVWVKQMGGTGADNGSSIALDASGNIYTTGSFNGTVDFDPGAFPLVFNLTSAGSNDVFISKLDASGNFVWANTMGGTGSDGGNSLALDASKNIYTTGSYSVTADFDPSSSTYNLTSAGGTDIFIEKFAAPSSFSSAQLCFSSATQFGIGTGTAPRSICSADFNNDGKMDLATADVSSNNIALLFGDGAGGFTFSVNSPAGTGPRSVISADFNRDGKMDLAVADNGAAVVSVLQGNGDGTFQAYVTYPTISSPISVICGYFNNDSYLDLATTGGPNNGTVLFGNSAGTFTTTSTFTTAAGGSPTGITMGYFNNDAYLDLAVANSSTSNVSILFGSSTGNFTAGSNFAVSSSPTGVISADFNADGNADLAVSNVNGVSVLFGTGTGSFGAASTYGVIGSNPTSVISEDFNGDGKKDLAVTTANNGLSVLTGNGDGTFQSAVNYLLSSGSSPYSVCSADFNGDGKPDLATANSGTNNVSVLLNTLITGSISKTNVSCYSGYNGSATATVAAGSAPYTYTWSNSDVTQTATGLAAGSISVTVTNTNGCTATASVTITQPAVLSVSVSSQTNVSCNGMCNGSATASATGGVSPYSYSWNTTPGSQTTQTATGLCFAGYLVTVTDINSCTATANVNITQPAVLSASAGSNQTICSGGNTALIGSAGGGTPNYNYNWSPAAGISCTSCGTTGASPTVTTTYTLTATDAHGCTKQASVVVTVNQPPSAPTAGSNSPLCSGQTLSLTASTLVGATYNWNGPNSFSSTSQNPAISGVTTVASGVYSVTSTLSGCTSPAGTTSISVNAIPSAPTAGSNSPVSIGNTLSLTASTIASATYSWLGPNSFSSATQNPAIAGVTTAVVGCYSVTATVNGCTGPAGTTCVTVPVVTFSITTSTQSVSCNGGNDGGAAVMSVAGGTSPYTYSWSTLPIQTDQAIGGLSAGTYTVTVTDAIGSSAAATVNIAQPSPISLVFTSPTNVSCYGGNNGKAHVIPGGGTSPYYYSWNSFPVQTTVTASNLAAGNYTVTVTDANGCTGTNTATITQPTALTVSMTIVNTDCGTSVGKATANVSGGTASYSYLWNTTQTTQTISNIASGNYSVTVTDSKGCSVNATTAVGMIPSNFNLAFSATIQNGAAPFNATFNNSTPSMSSYNFKWFYGDGSSANDNNGSVFYTYSFAGTYDVALVATSIASSCTDTLVKTHYINVTGAGCTHTASVTPTGPINKCQGDTVILTAGTNAVAPFTYQWNIGSVAISGANNSTLAVTQGGLYSVAIIKNNCSVTSSAVQVNFTTHPQQPVVTSAGNIVPCLGGAVTLTSSTISGAAYSWNTTPVQTTLSVVVSSSGNYVVTAINSSGCTTASAPFTVNASLAQVPICLVTVDTVLSQNNIIVWDKPAGAPIDSFIIYREISTNNYKPIGRVSYDSLSMFKDTVRTKYFPNTGNPNAGTYRYKIAVRDTCGNYSPMSLYHNTIYIINNSGIFFWPQLYTIENSANPVTSYVLMRDNTSTGNWQPVQSVAGTQQTVTDPQYSTYQNTASWRVQTQWNISCAPTIINPKDPDINSINLNSSRSNVYRLQNPNNVINTNADMIALVYPNPSSGFFTIDLKNNITGSAVIKVFNMMGEEVYVMDNVKWQMANGNTSTVNHQPLSINLSKLAGGVYYLQIVTHEQTITKKIVIE